ncbi:YdcH family protein [Rhodoferax sp.]|uniref:YdcH family protein n=1 Tax=Rhodoferax sp. TaxID=50421 RepID=UPI00283D85F2|nr:YdcH family protein [Rhodoferax sp.]MDR3369823.1 YdcH family protein [Rhodoferax sp.]
MFSEYREQIAQLKLDDAHFAQIFERHDALDAQIKRIEAHMEPGTTLEIEALKKEKLHLKDEVYQLLLKAQQA